MGSLEGQPRVPISALPAGTPRAPQTVPEELLSYVTAAYLSWCRYQGIVGVAHLMLMRG